MKKVMWYLLIWEFYRKYHGAFRTFVNPTKYVYEFSVYTNKNLITIICAVIFENSTLTNLETIQNIYSSKPTDINIIKSQENYLFCSEIIKALKNILISPKYKKLSRKYIISNQILYFKRFLPKHNIKNAIMISKDLIQSIISAHHTRFILIRSNKCTSKTLIISLRYGYCKK